MARDERAQPRELEDLGGAPALDAAARLDAPDEADRARLLGDAAVAVVRAGLVGGLYENSSGNRVDGVAERKDAASARSPPATGFRKGAGAAPATRPLVIKRSSRRGGRSASP